MKGWRFKGTQEKSKWMRRKCHSHQVVDIFFGLIAIFGIHTYGHPKVSTCRKKGSSKPTNMPEQNSLIGQRVDISYFYWNRVG